MNVYMVIGAIAGALSAEIARLKRRIKALEGER
jgi:hypothetical protein